MSLAAILSIMPQIRHSMMDLRATSGTRDEGMISHGGALLVRLTCDTVR
jgi:hypothetical protein